MGGFNRKINWFSPRAVKEPTPRVVEEQIGANSFRYRVKRKDEPNRLEAGGIQDLGPSYEDYRTRKEKKKDKKRGFNQNNVETFKGVTHPRRNVNDHWTEDDYYGHDNIVHYNSNPYSTTNRYAWTPTRWQNWGYSSFLGLSTDSDENLFVKAPENYLTPTVEQINAKTNYWTHADVTRIKELARVCYFKMIDETEYIAEKFEDPNCGYISPQEWKRKKELYDNVYTSYVPGFTPLEQAIAINHKYNDVLSKENRTQHKGNGGNRSRGWEFRRSDYADPYINSQLTNCSFNKKYNLDILNNISIMGDMGSQFKVEKEVGEHEVGYSDKHSPKLMQNYDQIRMIDMYQRMLHGYNVKFLTKNLVVNVPVETSERKQIIIILLDFSGSMNETKKQIWVNSILMDRFRYVMKGEAEVYISYFVSSTSFLKFKHIKTEKDVEDFWKRHDNYPNGSYTNIGRNVEYVADQIRQGKLHNLNVDLSKSRPELLLINDGEDEVGYDSFSYKVNAISLMRFSGELKALCVNTGGKQVYITERDTIKAYSDQGEEIISE